MTDNYMLEKFIGTAFSDSETTHFADPAHIADESVLERFDIEIIKAILVYTLLTYQNQYDREVINNWIRDIINSATRNDIMNVVRTAIQSLELNIPLAPL